MTPEELERKLEEFVQRGNNGTIKKILVPIISTIVVVTLTTGASLFVWYGQINERLSNHLSVRGHHTIVDRMRLAEQGIALNKSELLQINKSLDRIEANQESMIRLLPRADVLR